MGWKGVEMMTWVKARVGNCVVWCEVGMRTYQLPKWKALASAQMNSPVGVKSGRCEEWEI